MGSQGSLFGEEPAPAKRRRPSRDDLGDAGVDEQRVELEPTDPSIVELDRELIRRGGFYTFVELAWRFVEPERPFVHSKMARIECEFLESVNPGETVVVNVPPGTGKSLIYSVLFPAWHGGGFRLDDPRFADIPTTSARFLTTSYSDGLVARDSMRHRHLVESRWYQDLTGIGVDAAQKNTEKEWWTTAGGSRLAFPLHGQVTGRHGDVVIVDDPIKPDDARLERAELETVLRWWTVTMPSRTVRAARAIRIIVMQRLHERDLAGYEIERGSRHLVLPMRFEENHPQRSEHDWRTEPGELLCPELQDQADVDTGEAQMTAYAVAGQKQQRPSPEGGGMFQRDWWRTYRQLPADAGAAILSLDATFKGNATSDFVALGAGFYVEGALYLHRVILERMGFKATCDAVRMLVAELRGERHRIGEILVEDAANGAAIVEDLQREIPGIVLVKPLGGKEARAHVSSAWCEAGNIRLLDGAAWAGPLVEQHAGFPNAAHDDAVDMLSQMVNRLAARASDRRYLSGIRAAAADASGRGLRRLGR